MGVIYPIKGKQQRGTFAAGSEKDHSTMALPSAGFIPGTDRDASQNADDVNSRGRPRQKRKLVQKTLSKQSSKEDMVATKGRKKCPACEQCHMLKDCYYAFPEQAPDWFIPKSGYTAMVKHKVQHDPDFQEQLRKQKRLRSLYPQAD